MFPHFDQALFILQKTTDCSSAKDFGFKPQHGIDIFVKSCMQCFFRQCIGYIGMYCGVMKTTKYDMAHVFNF